MKKSNRILVIYAAAMAAFSAGSLAANVAKYRRVRPQLEQTAAALGRSRAARVVVVEAGSRVEFYDGKPMIYNERPEIATAHTSGDTLYIYGRFDHAQLPQGLEVKFRE